MVLWLLPPFKQYGTEYFYFFVVLAAADPIMVSAYYILRIQPQIIAPFTLLILIASMRLKKLLWLPFAFVFLFILIWFSRESKIALPLINSFCHFVVFMMIISRLIDQLSKRQLLSGFLVLLSVYELINVLKTIIVITDILNGLTQFYIASFFQILFGLLFSFISVKSSRLDFKLVKD